MRQLGNIAAILFGLALMAWSALAISGAEISWLATKFSWAGRERSEALLPGLLGLALLGYASFNLLLDRRSPPNSESVSGKSSPEA
jgi:hypothetical protein